MGFVTVAAISASAVLNTIGVNTHLDSFNYGYQDLTITSNAITYLGVRNLRDSAQGAWDLALWKTVAAATGARFDDYMGRGSPAQDMADLAFVPALAAAGVLNYLEGGDENDVPEATEKGNSIAWTASFQKQVYTTGHALGLPVINMSFGAGWTAANNWHGNYDKVGDMSPYCDYGNAHTYPGVGQLPDKTIQTLNADARLAAASWPVMTTEIGWDAAKFTPQSIAAYTLDAVFDGIKDGNPKMYFYALFDDNAGKFGLMNANGTPKPAGAALHNLTTILADAGAAAAGSLTYSLTGMAATDYSLLIRKSTGAYDLVLWNETGAAHTVTVALPKAAAKITVYNPLVASTARTVRSGAASMPVQLSGSPIIVEIDP